MKINESSREIWKKLGGFSPDGYLVAMVAVNLVITALLFWLILWLSGWFWFSFFAATIIWAAILLRTPLASMMFVEIEEFHGAVFTNQLVSEPKPQTETEKTQLNEAVSLRETTWGYKGKLPWEKVTAIDLREQIILTPELVVYTADNVELLFKPQVVLTPLETRLTFLVRRNEETIKAVFGTHLEQYSLKIFKETKEEDVYKEEFKARFVEVFGGPEVVSKMEKQYGVYTNTPEIKKIERTKEFQEAAQGKIVGERMAEAVGKLKEALPGIDPDVAAGIGLALVGKGDPNLNIITGLKNVDPKVLQGLAHLGIGGQPQKKGNK